MMTGTGPTPKRFRCVVFDSADRGLGIDEFDTIVEAEDWARGFFMAGNTITVEISDRLGSKSRCYELKDDERIPKCP